MPLPPTSLPSRSAPAQPLCTCYTHPMRRHMHMPMHMHMRMHMYVHAHAHMHMPRLLAKLAVPPRRWKKPKLPQLAAAPEERVRCEAAESQEAGRGGGSGWRGADGGQVSVEAAAIEHYAARGWPVRGDALHSLLRVHRVCTLMGTAWALRGHCMCMCT